MLRPQLALALVSGCYGSAIAGLLDPPRPEALARAEDQERARLSSKACTEADVGRGCFRYGNQLIREAPCSYHISSGAIGFLPIDQCYRMDKPRRFKGVWIDAFEGQRFIPEGTTPHEWPRTEPTSSGWKEQADRAIAAAIWLDVDRVKLGHDFRNGGRRMLIEFVGRKTMYTGSYGHMGMSGNEIIIDRVISIKEIE